MVYSKQLAKRALELYKELIEELLNFSNEKSDAEEVAAKLNYLKNEKYLIFNLEGVYFKNASSVLKSIEFMLKDFYSNEDA